MAEGTSEGASSNSVTDRISASWLAGSLPEVRILDVTSWVADGASGGVFGNGDPGHPVLRGGPGRLGEFAAALVGQMTEFEQSAVAHDRRTLSADTQWGTMCSGTEVPAKTDACLQHALEKRVGVKARRAQAFAVEKNPAKRKFIQITHPSLASLFEDCLNLSEPVCTNTLTNQVVPIPAVHDAIAGFPCQDASKYSPKAHSEQSRSCIMQEDLRTGSVFSALAKYMSTRCGCGSRDPKPTMRWAILENVPGLALPPRNSNDQSILGPSNATVVASILRMQCGASVCCVQVDPRCFGMPVSRPRLYFLAFTPTDYEHTEDELYCLVSSLLQRICRFPIAELDDFLLPMTDREVRARMWQLGHAEPTMPRCRRAKKMARATPEEQWALKHWDRFRTHGSAEQFWTSIPDEDTFIAFPGLSELSQREFDILRFANVAFPERQTRLADVSHSVDRISGSCSKIGLSPCLTSRSRLYSTSQCRLIAGEEKLRLQGLFVDSDLLKHFDDAMLQDLAGNAMDSSCVMAMQFVANVCSAVLSLPACSPSHGVGSNASMAPLPDEEAEQDTVATISTSRPFRKGQSGLDVLDDCWG